MVDYSTFDNFISSTLGDTIGDGECWAYINLIWSHLGGRYYTYPPSDPSSTNHGVKWGWINTEARNANTIPGIIQVPNLNDVKRGDIIVISQGTYGHAGFSNGTVNNGRLDVYSQNWNYRYVTLDNISMSTFVGAFRYTAWNPTPPTPGLTAVPPKRKPFKWVLYANKIRSKY